ncbi:hypothetical protein KUTeg_010158 [Tegillarca granosa]|uniref:Uncharacterized protein n=1 Tax=Tegillarca granosa TaxID=220873 RepID=A0ABQ9F5X8_TEGGR|nr:hypothetical protein KUTeg_010158 [Tegillarca granosa]
MKRINIKEFIYEKFSFADLLRKMASDASSDIFTTVSRNISYQQYDLDTVKMYAIPKCSTYVALNVHVIHDELVSTAYSVFIATKQLINESLKRDIKKKNFPWHLDNFHLSENARNNCRSSKCDKAELFTVDNELAWFFPLKIGMKNNLLCQSRECLNSAITTCVNSLPCMTTVTTITSISKGITSGTTTTTTTTTTSAYTTSTVAITTTSATHTAITTSTLSAPPPPQPPSSSVSSISSSPSSVTTNNPTPPSLAAKPVLPSPLSRSPTPKARPQHISRPPSTPTFTKDHRKSTTPTPPPSRTPRREEYRREEYRDREKDYPLPSNISFPKPWPGSSTPNHHHHHPYSPHISQSPGLSPFSSLHSGNPVTPGFTPSHPSLHPTANPHTPGHPHSMFATPLPPGPSTTQLTSSNLGGGGSALSNQSSDSMSIASQEILREELNRRFLAAQDRSTATVLGPPPYMRADIHQHQHMHQHQHQHTHQHMYPLPPPFSASLVPTPAPHLIRYDKIPRFESPFYKPGVSSLQGYPGVSPLVPPAGPGPLNSGIPGAFQPKI